MTLDKKKEGEAGQTVWGGPSRGAPSSVFQLTALAALSLPSSSPSGSHQAQPGPCISAAVERMLPDTPHLVPQLYGTPRWQGRDPKGPKTHGLSCVRAQTGQDPSSLARLGTPYRPSQTLLPIKGKQAI